MHFFNNKFIQKIFLPIVDTIGRLENESTNIGDILVQFIICKQEILKVQIPQYQSHLEEFKLEVLELINKYSKKYTSESEIIYIVGLFLCPRFRKVATSKQFVLKNIVQKVLTIANAWGMATESIKNLGKF